MLVEAREVGDVVDVIDRIGDDVVVADVGEVEGGDEEVGVSEGLDEGRVEIVDEDVNKGRVVELLLSALVTAVRTSVTTRVVGEDDTSGAALTIFTLGVDEGPVLLRRSCVTGFSTVFVEPFSSTILVVTNVVVAGGSGVITVLV